MQQYFLNEELSIGKDILLREDIYYHLTKVLRQTNTTFRLVDSTNSIYLAKLNGKEANIIEKLNEDNELNCNITVILALIKHDKFELTLQKLTELGVNKIVPFNAKRSVVKEIKADKKQERYTKIVTEAAEQSHRNKVPIVEKAINMKDVKNYLSDINVIAYEKEDIKNKSALNAKSVTIVIGPEGGFEIDEVNNFISMGFKSISLGKRILRAETAAIYLTSLIVGENE